MLISTLITSECGRFEMGANYDHINQEYYSPHLLVKGSRNETWDSEGYLLDLYKALEENSTSLVIYKELKKELMNLEIEPTPSTLREITLMLCWSITSGWFKKYIRQENARQNN